MQEPGEFDVQEFELPELGPNDVLMRVELNGVCGTDIHINEGGMDLDFPVLPGHEFAGRVEELGGSVENDARGRPLKEGDPITAIPFWPVEDDWYSENVPTREVLFEGITGLGMAPTETGNVGGMSEYMVLPEEADVYRLPEDMNPDLGALAEPLSIGVRAYERATMPGFPDVNEGVGLGSSVAVQGAGTIGLLTIAAAHAGGSGQIIAIDAIEERLELARKFGATDTVNIAEYDGEDEIVAAVKAKTDSGHGPTAVIEATGIPQTVRQAIEIPHDGGIFVEAGHYAYNGEVEINPTRIVQKELTIIGSKAAPASQFKTAVELLPRLAEEMPLEDLFNHRVSIDDVADAYETQAAGNALRASIHPHGV
ncbi:zinc-binding dehydrogenase [Natronolimnobius sp. AArcel1]|uniref:zinc-dependent alcohol dehydrogenase n=1 Tax=Natronolimnobius sp. AArcel1 TaxID=1679093 RepID=UPI0013ED4EF5|nr:zinc-binding dehydrogenase [Natronolimnobius sp. AArcel1]NGM70375.1 zinc-binding dehydrogenase [Natronolimnobius sp. AArcel1]